MDLVERLKVECSFENTSGCQKIIISVNKNKQSLDQALEFSQTTEQFLKSDKARRLIEKAVQYR